MQGCSLPLPPSLQIRPSTERSYLVILTGVKTAISIPDDTFERASTRARDLGISRSQFFTTAAQHYLDELDAQSITLQIDTALSRLAGTDQSAADAVAMGHRTLADTDEEW